MKKSYIILIAVVGLLFLVGSNACSTYNGFVDKSENVKNAWANVETPSQRRFVLIGNLV
jgi:LemA protein